MGWMHRDHARDNEPVDTLRYIRAIRLENPGAAAILRSCFDNSLSPA